MTPDTPARIYAIVHKTCGHVGGCSYDKKLVEQQRELAAAAGYHGWRVRLVDATTAIANAVAMPNGCEVCHMDPTRGQLPAVAEHVSTMTPSIKLVVQ